MNDADSAELTRRVAALRLAEVQRAFETQLPAGTPYHVREATGLEYRRLLLLRLLRPDLEVTATGPVATYARLHAADPDHGAHCAALTVGLTPSHHQHLRVGAGDRPTGAAARDLYDQMFPCGDTDLWGRPPRSHAPRRSAPSLSLTITRMPHTMPEETRAALRDEALTLMPAASEGHASDFATERGCVSGGSGAFRHANAGPALWERHWNGETAHAITAATGTAVVPTGLSYNFHDAGAASPLHNDPYAAELALLTLLDGPIENLYCHPDLADTPLPQLLDLARQTGGLPDYGHPHQVSPTPMLLPGQSIPHHRRPSHRHAPVIVAAQFFGVLRP